MSTVSEKDAFLLHQEQYDCTAAKFFNDFNRRTGRETLFWGYMEGHLSNNGGLAHKESIAVDIGCGAGWWASYLSNNFHSVYGIDTSASMLKLALANKCADNITYHQKAPEDILGSSDLVTALHVHYHFNTGKRLEQEFFQVAENLLKPGGEFLLIGCPSDFLRFTPAHYTNYVKARDIPSGVSMSQISLLADDEGYVPFGAIPSTDKNGRPVNLKDGTQMKVVFNMLDDDGTPQTLSLIDTFWSDNTLITTAEKCGLVLEQRKDMTWREESTGAFYPHAYMALLFKKPMP